jgi:FAD-linked sulfhydryl oxidase
MPRRQHVTLLAFIGAAAFLATLFVSVFRNQAEGTRHPDYIPSYVQQTGLHVVDGILHGEATAPKLENATLK